MMDEPALNPSCCGPLETNLRLPRICYEFSAFSILSSSSSFFHFTYKILPQEAVQRILINNVLELERYVDG